MLYKARDYFFVTLTNRIRLRVIDYLRENGPKNVTQICAALKMDQTTVSHNLSRLRNCGFVIAKKNGKERVYSINKETLDPLLKLIEKHTEKYCMHCIRN